jgi:hypothetical protein
MTAGGAVMSVKAVALLAFLDLALLRPEQFFGVTNNAEFDRVRGSVRMCE